MIIFKQLKHQLNQLVELLKKINTDEYTYKSKFLSNASIGGHTRHIIELLHCSINGHQTGTVDYVNRTRNMELENNIDAAIGSIEVLYFAIKLNDKPLLLITEDDSTIDTTYYRELVYNVEHIIHHLALIKVSLIELNLKVVDENFGYAYSTIQYNKSLQVQA